MKRLLARRALGAVGVAFAIVLVAAAPAAAHTEFLGSDPAEGSTGDAPAEIVLEFSGALLAIGTMVEVRGTDGEDYALDVPEIRGERYVAQAVRAMPVGEYAVVWRVVAGDGHPIEGEYVFFVVGGDQVSLPETPAPTRSTESPSGIAPSAVSPSVIAPTVGPPTLDSDGGGLLSADGWVWRAVVVAAVLIVVFRLAIMRFIVRQR